MAEPFLAEIRIMSFEFAPKGWAVCNGQFLPVNQNQALFSLLGTTFGGDGTVNFALPDLRTRVPIHAGGGHTLGERAGEQAHTLSIAELPAHTHLMQASPSGAAADAPDAGVLLGQAALDLYRAPTSLGAMEPGIVASAGGSQRHPNMQPYLALSFCIALQGIFPSPS